MATKRVNIDIVAKDKSQRALQGVRGSLDRVKASVFNVRNALVGLGGGLVIRSLVNTGKEIESLKVRLKFLFGSAEEGAKAFDEMAKFAAKVPFSLEQIQQGAGVLSVVSKDAEELADIMEITGNVAAVTGLDFRTTSEQIQRSLSAGIASADLFREKGVRDLLGFKAGATVTAEETALAFEKVFGANGRFGKATDELAKTFEGTLSMIGDSFFQFKRDILDAGFFPELKRQFGDLDDFIKDNEKEIKALAESIGKNLAGALKNIVKFGKGAAENIELFGIAVAGMALILAPQITTITLLATAVFKIAQAFDQAKMEAIGITKEFEKQTWMELTDSINKINLAMTENVLTMEEYKKKFDGITDPEYLQHLDLQLTLLANENLEYEKQIAIINRLIKEKKDLGEAIQVQTMAVTSLMEAEALATAESIKANQKRADMNKKIAQAEADEKVRINKIGLETIQSNTKDALQTLSGINKTAFEAYKRIRIAEATIEAVTAASKAFRQFPFPVNIAVSASALAKGMAMVAQIKSTNFRAGGGSVNKGQAYMVGEKGPEMFVPSGSGKVVANNQMGGGQPVNVNFNINTVDARGFNELLTNSRGVIVNMINSAVNETGRQAIV